MIEVSFSGLSPIRPVLHCSSHDALDGADGACMAASGTGLIDWCD